MSLIVPGAVRLPLVGSLVVAGLSLPVVLPAPDYDPWAWLLWGREIAAGELNTIDGPAFKPLPVAICAALALFGPAASWLWVLVARTASVIAAWLAYRLARRLAGGSVPAGVVAFLAVFLCGRYLLYTASGMSEGILLALALAGVEAGRTGRPRGALACAVGCALLRVETWPFLLVAAMIVWRRRPQDRPLLVAAVVAVAAAWIVPEIVGSGDPLRSASRAQRPEPGQPALSRIPVLASGRAALALPLGPLWVGCLVLIWRATARRDRAARVALAPAAAGLAWIGLVAAMAQTGFSGEPRYALPGAALVGTSGAVGLVFLARGATRGRRAAGALIAAVLVLTAAPRTAHLSEVREAQAHRWTLQSDLARAVEAVGGRHAVLACGKPYVGPLRGPLLAYHLAVHKQVVEPDGRPHAPGMVFRSALTAGADPTPLVPAGFATALRGGAWQVYASCASGP